MAAVADAPHVKSASRDANLFAGLRAAEIDFERPIDRKHVEPEKAEHGPCAHQEKSKSRHKAHRADKRHQHQKAGAAERAVRLEPRGEQFRLERAIKVIAWVHGVSVYPDYAENPAQRFSKSKIRTTAPKSKIAQADCGQTTRQPGRARKSRQKDQTMDAGRSARGVRALPQGQSRAQGRA